MKQKIQNYQTVIASAQTQPNFSQIQLQYLDPKYTILPFQPPEYSDRLKSIISKKVFPAVVNNDDNIIVQQAEYLFRETKAGKREIKKYSKHIGKLQEEQIEGGIQNSAIGVYDLNGAYGIRKW